MRPTSLHNQRQEKEQIGMDDWQGRIDALQERALAELDKADEHESIEQWRITYLGRRGALTEMLRGLAGLPADQRPAAGQSANEVKRVLESALERQQGTAR